MEEEKHEHWCNECGNIFYKKSDLPYPCPECGSLNVEVDYEEKNDN